MDSPLRRKDRMDGIEDRIDRLGERARDLLEREQAAVARVEDLRRTGGDGAGRLRRAKQGRTVRRAERRVEELRATREGLIDGELRRIMLALEKRSRRTRDRLDRELERLAPVERDWERLRRAFDALESTVAAPPLEQLAAHLRGTLEIPEFPVREREGYAKPFPQRALLF
jgi:hypothetical protein